MLFCIFHVLPDRVSALREDREAEEPGISEIRSSKDSHEHLCCAHLTGLGVITSNVCPA